MPEEHVRKTQARVAERERRRAAAQARKKLPWELGLVVVAIIAIAAGIYMFVAGSASNGSFAQAPRFQVDTTKEDLGNIPLGKTVHASFTVRNSGGGALTLNVPQMPTVLNGC